MIIGRQAFNYPGKKMFYCEPMNAKNIRPKKINWNTFSSRHSSYTSGLALGHVALLSGIGGPDREMRRLAKYGTRFFTKPLDFAEVEAWMAATESPYD